MEEVLQVLIRAGSAAVHGFGAGGGLFAIHFPQIANRGHLHVVLGLEAGSDPRQFRTAAANTDLAKLNAVIGAYNPRIRQGRGTEDAGPGNRGSRLMQKRSSTDLRLDSARIVHSAASQFFHSLSGSVRGLEENAGPEHDAFHAPMARTCCLISCAKT